MIKKRVRLFVVSENNKVGGKLKLSATLMSQIISFCSGKLQLSKVLIILSVFFLWIFLPSISSAAPYFRVSSLINIPTAYTLPEGVFNAGIHIAIHDQERKEIGLKTYFGLFDFTEIGLMKISDEDNDYIIGNLKLLIFRESGINPAISIGVDNFGEKIEDEAGYYERSIYGVISKQFNLPLLHFISGHLGIGNNRYSDEASIGKYLHGVFFGLDKKFQLPYLNSQLHVMGELDGRTVNVGLQYLMDSGLSLALASGDLASEVDGVEYYLALNFSNENIMKKINQSAELAKRAVKIANDAILKEK